MAVNLIQDPRYAAVSTEDGKNELQIYLDWIVENGLDDSEQNYIEFVKGRAGLADGRHLFKVWEKISEELRVEEKARLQIMRFFLNPSAKSFAKPDAAGWFDFLPQVYDLMEQVPPPIISRPEFQKVGFIYSIEKDRVSASKQTEGSSVAPTLRTGVEVRELSDGRTYRGTFKGDFCDGPGLMSWPNGDEFTGEYVMGDAKRGLYIFSSTGQYSGHSYEGEMRDGLFHGHGVYTFPDGQQNSGVFVEGQFAAPSVELTFDNGDSYVGGVNEENCFHYYGTYHYADGSEYSGDYSDGQMTKGIYVFSKTGPHAGHVYEGELLNGKFHGNGKYTFPNGTQNIGRFVAGVYQGS
jgi:hypothetical protein